MLAFVSNPRDPNKVGALQLLAMAVYVAWLLRVFTTANFKSGFWLVLLSIAASSADYYVGKAISREPALSLLSPIRSVKPRVVFGPIQWLGFGLLLVSFLFIPHVRIFAALAMPALPVLFLGRIKNLNSEAVRNTATHQKA
jgi:hypothetical protein